MVNMFDHKILGVKFLETLGLELKKDQLRIDLKAKFESNKKLYRKELQVRELKKQLRDSIISLDKYAIKCNTLSKKSDDLTRQNAKLNKTLKTETERLNKTKIDLDNCLDENKSLKKECVNLKGMMDHHLQTTNGIIQATSEKCMSLEKQYKTIKISNDQTKEELKKEITNRKSLSNELRVEKGNLEKSRVKCNSLEKRCDNLTKQNAQLSQALKKETKKLNETKIALDKCLDENRSLKDECANLSGTIQKTNGIVGEVTEKYNSLETQYKTLQRKDNDTNEELKIANGRIKMVSSQLRMEKEENARKNDIIKKYEEDAFIHENVSKTYEEKANQLNNELQDYRSNEMVQAITTLSKNLDIMNKNCIIVRDKFAKEIQSHNRTPCITTIESLQLDYQKYEADLRRYSVTRSKRVFLEKIQEYKDTCAIHDKKWKDIIREAFHLPKSIDVIREHMKIGISAILSDIQSSIGEANQCFNTLSNKTLTEDFDKEKDIYIKTVDVARNEIYYLRNLSQFAGDLMTNPKSMEHSTTQQTTDDDIKQNKQLNINKEENTALAGNPKIKTLNTDEQAGTSSAFHQETKPNDQSIVIYNLLQAKSSVGDIDTIVSFLSPYKLNTEDYEIHILKKTSLNNRKRPVVVNFKNSEIVNTILANEKHGRHFNGSHVRVNKLASTI